MPEMSVWQQFGLVGIMVGGLFAFLFLLTKWIIGMMNKLLDQASKERDVFSALQREWIEAIDAHTRQAESFHDNVKTAAEYQRQEHIKMMESLTKLDDRTRSCLIK